MTRTEITVKTVIDLDIKTGAAWFAGLNDEEQVQFFNEVAAEAKSWPRHADFQWCSIGKHLAECDCTSEAAREMIRSIAQHMDHYLTEALYRGTGPDAPAIDVHPQV